MAKKEKQIKFIETIIPENYLERNPFKLNKFNKQTNQLSRPYKNNIKHPPENTEEDHKNITRNWLQSMKKRNNS